MNPWWWVPLGLLAWCIIALVVGLWLGPILKRRREEQEGK